MTDPKEPRMTDTQTAPDISAAERNARLDGPVHTWFGLTYSNYLVLPRALMQSMPVDWQQRMVACLDEIRDAYNHLNHPDAYEVTASVECTYSDLNESDMQELGITGPTAPADGEDSDEDRYYYDKRGDQHYAWERVLVPRLGGDPIPHYNRGRTFVPPVISPAPDGRIRDIVAAAIRAVEGFEASTGQLADAICDALRGTGVNWEAATVAQVIAEMDGWDEIGDAELAHHILSGMFERSQPVPA